MTTTPDITEWLPSSDAEAADVYIGKIPIRNIWLLLLYASELYQYLPRHRRVALEEAPDNIPDLNQSQGGMCICRKSGTGLGVSQEGFGP